MPLTLLVVTLSLLQGCIAPAVSDVTANLTSPSLDTNISLASSNSTPDTCNDLHNCRTLFSIIISCLTTIFACVWVSVHPNVPGPRQSWTSKQFESFKIVVLMVLVPEWVLAWAMRQRWQAKHYAGILESARVEAADEATLQHNRNSTEEGHTPRSFSNDQKIGEQAAAIRLEDQSTLYDNSSKDIAGSISEVTTGEGDNERTMLIPHQSLERSTPVPPELASTLINWQLESELGRIHQSWTRTHAFLIGMGGFHSYRGGQPMFPLDYDDVLALVKSRSLVPPTLDELQDRSKGDAFSMAIASSQTLWFFIQFAGRSHQKLAITNLEVMTLAYCIITAGMYFVSFQKPINVRCPIRVKGENERSGSSECFRWSHIFNYVIGDQDRLIRLSAEERVPTFWSSCSTKDNRKNTLLAYFLGLEVAFGFGFYHGIPWQYEFPSLTEKWMWRVCTVVIAAIPVAMAVACAVLLFFASVGSRCYASIQRICLALGALYIPARIILIVLSFSTLRDLPVSAYQIVQWTKWLPHI